MLFDKIKIYSEDILKMCCFISKYTEIVMIEDFLYKRKGQCNMVQSLARGIEILSIIQEKGSTTAVEIATELDVDKSTVSRLISTLMQYDMISIDPISKKYRLGFRLLYLSEGVKRNFNIAMIARPYLYKICDETKESVLEFVDISTLPERMKNKTTIVHEFLGNYSGWCRERFIRVDEDSNGELWHVVYAVEVIDAEKRKENRLLYLSETDLMTGIRNRGSGEKAITDLIKEGTKGLMCLLDCDKFKNVNDTYGHVVGDAVIIAVARSLQSVCREHDICMRLGGDEFAMFIPGITETKDAESFTMRVFAKLKDIRIPEMGDEKIYVSMGEAFYKGEKDIDFDELYRHADSAMYKSKNNTGYCATLECVTKTF